MCITRCRCWSPIDKIFGNLALLRENLPFHPDDGGNVKQSAQWVLAKVGRELGIMFTGGSSSVKDAWLPMREAGAVARAADVGAAIDASDVRLKEPREFRLIGQPAPRLDARAKASGSALFGVDARPPGLVYAAVKMAPVVGATVASFDAARVRAALRVGWSGDFRQQGAGPRKCVWRRVGGFPGHA